MDMSFMQNMQGFPMASLMGSGGGSPMMGGISPTSQTPASPMPQQPPQMGTLPPQGQTMQMPNAPPGPQSGMSPQGMELMKQLLMSHGMGGGNQQQSPLGQFTNNASPGIMAMLMNRMGTLSK